MPVRRQKDRAAFGAALGRDADLYGRGEADPREPRAGGDGKRKTAPRQRGHFGKIGQMPIPG